MSSGQSLLEDEELEDGFTGLDQEISGGVEGARLSRDLERGFRDDSDSDEEDGTRGQGIIGMR